MQSSNKPTPRLLRADANALGGYLDAPVARTIPTLAPVSLPAVGGFTTARSEAFTLDDIVSCSAAYARVSGRQQADGSSSIVITAVVENLNVLEVVRAQRLVAQVGIEIPADAGAIKVSLAGCGFEGLSLAGQACRPKLNGGLLPPDGGWGCCDGLTWEDVRRVGHVQGEKLLAGFKGHSEDAYQWAQSRYGRMTAANAVGDRTQASLVDALECSGATRGFGHIMEIPQCGRLFFGELVISRTSVQLVGIRAELGCGPKGRISILCLGGSGTDDD